MKKEFKVGDLVFYNYLMKTEKGKILEIVDDSMDDMCFNIYKIKGKDNFFDEEHLFRTKKEATINLIEDRVAAIKVNVDVIESSIETLR